MMIMYLTILQLGAFPPPRPNPARMPAFVLL